MSYQRGAMYSPDKEMFICETAAERDELADRGWLSLPEDYKPDEAVHVQFMPEAKAKVKAVAKPAAKPAAEPAKRGRPAK